MKKMLPQKLALEEKSAGAGKMSRRMVRERAVELAILHGRSAQSVSKADWEQAKREANSETGAEPDPVLRESAAESEQWDPLSGSTGYKVHVPSGDDEDDEGRSDTERLVERGVNEAGRERMREADQDAIDNE